MLKYIIAFIFFISSAAYAAGPVTINQLPAGGALTGSEPVPTVQAGQTVMVTAQSIANLNSGGGGSPNVGTALVTQPLYNNSGTVGGIPIFYVTNYGAKCDGTILYSGVQTTNGSPIIHSPDYTFANSDVGAHITLTKPAAANTYFQSGIFDGTIISVAGGNATLSGNVTFTAGPSFPGASARFYHTDDSVAIQNALDAASVINSSSPQTHTGGAQIKFPGGVCVAQNLVFYSNEHIVGEGVNATTIMLAANANSDLFSSYEYNALAALNTNSNANPLCLADGNCGTYGWWFTDISLDGNRGSNTGSAANSKTGSGDGIRAFGSSFVLNNVYINFFKTDGIYTLWPQGGGGVPYYTSYSSATIFGMAYPDGLEAFVNNFEAFYNGGWGWVDNGPHDSVATNMWFSGNNTGGILNEVLNGGGGSPLTIYNYHAYQHSTGKDLDIESPFMQCVFCDLETGVTVNAAGAKFTNSLSRSTIFLNAGATSSTFTNFSQTAGQALVATSVPSSGAADKWLNSAAGTIGGGYTPNVTTNSTGFGQQQTNVSANPYALVSCSTTTPFACINELVTSMTSTLVSLANTTSKVVFMTIDNNENVAFGQNAVAPRSLLGADFTAYTTGLGLPTGTLAQRPACQGSNTGAVRYSLSLNGVEFCNGNTWNTLASGVVSLNVANVFNAGQSVTPITITPTASSTTYTPSLAAGNNFIITLSSSCPCTLANPPSFVPGQSGMIYVVQDGSGSRLINTYGSQYIFSGGTAPTLSTGANAIDVLSYSTITISATNYILINASLNFHN